MRLADAYRRLHPRTSDSDDSTVHSTHTNETEFATLGADGWSKFAEFAGWPAGQKS